MDKYLTLAISIALLGLSGCVVTPDPYYLPQATTYGTATRISVPSTDEGVDILTSGARLAKRVPQQETMRVSWDLKMANARSSRPSKRSNCEVLIKPAGSFNYVPYHCDRVEKDGRDYMVYFWFKDNLTAVNLATMPGDFIRNGFCESEWWKPSRRLQARVVWQTHETVRPSRGLARAIGCKPG